MQLQTGPIRFRIEASTELLQLAVDCLALQWPTRHADPSDLEVQVCTRLCLYESPVTLTSEQSFVREGDPAKGAWRMGQDPLWIAEGNGLDSVSVTLATNHSQGIAISGLQQFFRHFVTEALQAIGGIAFHAAAVARPAGAYVFLSPSGGGKTTLIKGHSLGNSLADDMTLVVPGRVGPWIVPSPFPGREKLQAQGPAAPLAMIVDLVKDEQAFVTRLSTAEALSSLILRAFMTDAAISIRERVMDASLRLARNHGVTRLGLPIERSPWPMLDFQ